VRHRVYQAHIGRWATRDPLGYVQGMSLYQYVLSQPILRTDPSGLLSPPSGFDPWPCAGGLCQSPLPDAAPERIVDLFVCAGAPCGDVPSPCPTQGRPVVFVPTIAQTITTPVPVVPVLDGGRRVANVLKFREACNQCQSESLDMRPGQTWPSSVPSRVRYGWRTGWQGVDFTPLCRNSRDGGSVHVNFPTPDGQFVWHRCDAVS
jgi:hypothetical protein